MSQNESDRMFEFPKSRVEKILLKILGDDIDLDQPNSRIENVLMSLLENGINKGSTIISGTSIPSDDEGSDGNLYIYYSDKIYPDDVYEYIRTNNYTLNIELSNWLYRTSDKIVLTYKNNSTTYSYNWPAFIAVSDSNILHIQYNLYGGRKAMNVKHGGGYSGDGSYAFESPYNKDKYYKIILDSNKFSLLSGLSLDSIIDSEVSETTIGSSNDTDTTSPILFPTNSNNTMDCIFYNLEVYRNDKLIHEYMPIENGVMDIVTNDKFYTNNTEPVVGDKAISNSIKDIYFKNDGVWSGLISSNYNNIIEVIPNIVEV